MTLSEPIDSLPNTSFITIRRLKSLDINSYWDLLNYFPFRYEDYSLISTINKVQEGEVVSIIGEIIDAKYQVARTGTRIQKFILQDKTGAIELTWYNQPYLLRLLKSGTNISVAGEIKRFGRKLIMEPHEYEMFDSNKSIHHKHTGGIIPIYPEKRGLSSRTIREKIFYILSHLDKIPELLPPEIIAYNELVDETLAYKNIHFPVEPKFAAAARKRLAFDEFFIIQLTGALIKKAWEKEVVGHQFNLAGPKKQLLQKFIDSLPFSLTKAQKKVSAEIVNDLVGLKPMNRFLQGDVGSGKTVVAALACYLTYLNGYKSLFMAPTEILAQQHFKTLINLFQLQDTRRVSVPNVSLITGTSKPETKNLRLADIIIGTHALIQKKLEFYKVGLVIIDEQHRFGVAQRSELKSKGINPHLLTMTATPIPRTVSLTLYGELDLSVIDEMPKGRTPTKTYLVPPNKRESGYRWIKEQILKDKVQVFIICPLIEESDVETMKSVKAAKAEYEFLKAKIFPEFRVGLLHGKLKSREKDDNMNKFKDHKIDILVATPVVEVGIDISNATIMLIEGAGRFGLAQLHQLRGRVGRGKKQSYCFLFTEKEDDSIIDRIIFFIKNHNGLALAEKDLMIRGPGELHGTKQHGYQTLKIASYADFNLIDRTSGAVSYFVEKYPNFTKFPEIKKRVEEDKIKQITRD